MLRRGKKTPISGGVVAVLSSDSNSELRCGVVVSKKVGNAVVRNTVKRRVRAACAPLAERFGGVMIVVRADQSSPQVSVKEWTRGLLKALDKVVAT